MGTWGDGIYDNDGALDELARLISLDADEPDPARLVAKIGLMTWMRPIEVMSDEEGELRRRVDALGDRVEALPDDTRVALEKLLEDPEAATKEGSRSKEAHAALGGYSDGPRMDALLRFSGASAVLDELAVRAVGRLERALRPGIDLYQAADGLAALGVLIELAQGQFWRAEPATVDAWRTKFAAIDRATKSERGFWWKYVRNVQRGFDLLAPSATPAAPAKPKAPVKPTLRKRPTAGPAGPVGPVQRFTHAKFGEATLVSRSGAGESEQLELKFADGSVRKILARFVTAIDG